MKKTMKKKTSFEIDEELWSRFKIKAIREGLTVTELLEQMMKRELRR